MNIIIEMNATSTYGDIRIASNKNIMNYDSQYVWKSEGTKDEIPEVRPGYKKNEMIIKTMNYVHNYFHYW